MIVVSENKISLVKKKYHDDHFDLQLSVGTSCEASTPFEDS
jgi:hypothetical protein